MTLRDRILAIPGGARVLAAGRLRYTVLGMLREAMTAADVDEAELARRLGVRRRRVRRALVGDGKISVNMLATMLAELGVELRVEVVPLGTQDAEREAAVEAHHRRLAGGER